MQSQALPLEGLRDFREQGRWHRCGELLDKVWGRREERGKGPGQLHMKVKGEPGKAHMRPGSREGARAVPSPSAHTSGRLRRGTGAEVHWQSRGKAGSGSGQGLDTDSASMLARVREEAWLQRRKGAVGGKRGRGAPELSLPSCPGGESQRGPHLRPPHPPTASTPSHGLHTYPRDACQLSSTHNLTHTGTEASQPVKAHTRPGKGADAHLPVSGAPASPSCRSSPLLRGFPWEARLGSPGTPRRHWGR